LLIIPYGARTGFKESGSRIGLIDALDPLMAQLHTQFAKIVAKELHFVHAEVALS